MFMDIPARGEGDYEPFVPRCRSCRQPIPPGAPREILAFPPEGEHRLDELNGPYHPDCARPFASLKRAMDMLSRPWG